MTDNNIRAIARDDQLRKRLAKEMALRCFRNTELENLHAGIVPNSKAGDYSDVKVVSPFGDIPWPELSRLSNREMKVLMIDVVNQCYRFLSLLHADPAGDALIEELKEHDPLPDWDEPR
jgi:hypothetical protein